MDNEQDFDIPILFADIDRSDDNKEVAIIPIPKQFSVKRFSHEIVGDQLRVTFITQQGDTRFITLTLNDKTKKRIKESSGIITAPSDAIEFE